MSQTFAQRNEAWEARARLLGERAVLHVGHKTPEAQAAVFEQQRAVIEPLFGEAVRHVSEAGVAAILDFGCGVGRWTEMLAAYGPVLGVDPTQQFLDICRRKHAALPGVAFDLYRDGRIPVDDGAVDVVYACMVLSTVLDVDGGMFTATLREIRRVLRRGGLMFLVDNTAGRGGRPVRSPYSISRTVREYQDAFNEHVGVALAVVGEYVDLGETNTVFAGRRVL